MGTASSLPATAVGAALAAPAIAVGTASAMPATAVGVSAGPAVGASTGLTSIVAAAFAAEHYSIGTPRSYSSSRVVEQQNASEHVLGAASQPRVVKLLVRDWLGVETRFCMKASSTLGKLMDEYCRRNDIDASQVKFSDSGELLMRHDTCDALGYVDDDIIDVSIVR